MALIKCPECGRDISDTVSKCPYCGYSIKKKRLNKKWLILIGIIILIVIIGLCYRFLYTGTFEISQTSDTIELGALVDPISYLKYDSQKVVDISISESGGFTSQTVGDYVVTFEVKNARGFTKEIPFEFHVKDTTPPEISVKNETVNIAVGEEYNPESNLIVNDADQYTVNISGEYDYNTEGTYTITASAQDNSGNESKQVEMSIIVEDMNQLVFRNAKFGDTSEIVREKENGEFLEEYYYDDNHLELSFFDTVEDEDAVIFYDFNLNDELYKITATFIEEHTNADLYLNHFYELTEKLTKLYKEPKEERNEGTLYSYCGSEGEALLTGQLQLQNTWDLEDYTVSLYIGSDNYEVITNLQYESKVIDEPQTNRIN